MHMECITDYRPKLIRKICDKWRSFESVKKLAYHPRISLLKLLMVLLKDRQDFITFMDEVYEDKLIQKWVTNYFFTDILDTEGALAITSRKERAYARYS